MIPKTLFTTYKPDINSNPECNNIVNVWRELNPTWDVKYFSDKDVALFFEQYKLGAEAYNILANGTAIADWFRICYIHACGGLWFDFDLGPFNVDEKLPTEMLDTNACFVDFGFKNISYMLIAGEKNSLLFEKAIESISQNIMREKERIQGKDIFPGMHVQGPKAFQHVVAKYFDVDCRRGNGFPASDTPTEYISTNGDMSFKYIKVNGIRRKNPKYIALRNNIKTVHWKYCL